MRARANFAIDAIALVIYIVATNPATTGTPVHEWVGIGVAFIAFVHLVSHWSWTIRTLKRFIGRVGRLSRLNVAVDALLLFAFVTVALSGLAVSRSALKPFGLVVADNSIWHAVHSQSATVLLVLMGGNLGLHWSWITSALRHRIFRPMLHPARTFVVLRDRAVADIWLDWRAVRRALLHAARRTAEVAVLVVLLAGCVFGLATQTSGRLLAPWLTMPGGSGTGLSAAVNAGRGVSAATIPVPAADTAESHLVSPAMRAAIRSAHAFLIFGIVIVLAMVFGDLLRPMRA